MMFFDKDDLRDLRESKKQYKKNQVKRIKNSSKILKEMGINIYHGKGGNWFDVYYKNKKYFYSPKTGKFKVQGGEWYKLGGFSNFVDYFKRDDYIDCAQSIIDEVNETFYMKKRISKDLITLLALGYDKEWVLSNVEKNFHKYGKFDWHWFDSKIRLSF